MRIPNFPVIDGSRNCLYVSDSYDPEEKGPGVWRFDLESGEGGLWYDRAMTFANGMALSPDKDYLYVAESFAGRVIRIPIDENGSPEVGELCSSVCLTVWHRRRREPVHCLLRTLAYVQG